MAIKSCLNNIEGYQKILFHVSQTIFLSFIPFSIFLEWERRSLEKDKVSSLCGKFCGKDLLSLLYFVILFL